MSECNDQCEYGMKDDGLFISRQRVSTDVPLGVLVWSKDVDGVIFMSKGLESLKAGLSVVQGCGTNVEVNVGLLQ